MLKALELVGFKSFADKTRFAFPSGITVVVGPNGSGKSNVVDAIKWVLGEQSVKSLRGKEMADVIFNGSGTRKAMNSAEITLTLDNSRNQLAVDTPEVQLTRRVYRSGEGEYLINRQPCRLRDIRDILAGTGMGTEAYSVIEQGKVDVLLQSSPRERRIIFEEAAGISRFRAKKLEALRRLEHVQQNLLRLSDIVEEVENRLKSIRAQAAKAQRYKQYTDRLQQLRTQVGLFDWRRLTERLTGLEAEAKTWADERDVTTAAVETLEVRLLETDTQTGELNEVLRTAEGQLAQNRERIAAAESAIEQHRARSRDLEEEIDRQRKQLLVLSSRAGDLEQQLTATAGSVEAVEEEHRQIARRLAEAERLLTEILARLDQLRSEDHQRRESLREQMRASSALASQSSGLEISLAGAAATRQRVEAHFPELNTQLAGLQSKLETLRRDREELTGQVQQQESSLAAARSQLDQQRREQQALGADLSQSRERHAGLAERISILDELEKRQEGISAGVREALALAHSGNGPLSQMCGLVADVFQANVETAALVEIALGPAAQHVIVPRNEALLADLREQAYRFTGRVGFVWLDETPPVPHVGGRQLDDQPGVVARADRCVETEPRFAALAERLLGRTWIVETLARAWALAAGPGRGCHFVTLSGEHLSADGTLVVGSRQVAAGIISRRSQLRSLRGQLADMQQKIVDLETRASQLGQLIAEQEQQVQQRGQEHREAVAALGENRFSITAAERDCARLEQQRAALEQELREASQQHAAAATALATAQTQRAAIDAAVQEMEAALADLAQHVARLEAEQRQRNQDATEVKIDLAKSDERLRSLRMRLHQFEESQQERQRGIAEGRQQLADSLEKERDCRFRILRAESEIALLYLRKEGFVAETGQLVRQRADLQQRRAELTAESQKIRAKIRKVEEQLHAKELEVNEVRHERQTLVDRLREDYGIELAQLENEPSAEEQHQREEAQQEIEQLRRKINGLGNVNLEALEELEQHETRFQTLSSQYKDLDSARNSLEKIIEKINTDSRRLFAETLQTVRGHFQELFRDLFGGGQADIIVEEGVDILECGIEIVARPPGKEPRSISLLSGGEKTLTCVALLLAIFRSRPSPFCVLDEVDAALDEANIHRFTKVLRDFLTWTQFIIITHSKKTMTCASTIYGITMQESGVSKQVSVRFEDVSDDGHIRPERLEEAKPDKEETQAA
jgi:chromosome segregation protein